MIINAQQSNIETFGDVKEFKTSIDPKNLEFITTLLSSNLYSNPEQSFIREIVSNAWDSHVEAGTTDTPVIISINGTKFRDDGVITIRDYGTGLSPERFKEIYCNIGSSTKRDSNDYIGGFGIGKYSALACSNTVYITSYYEGIAYYYVMVKSGNAITTNLLTQKPTTEKNGVEVTIRSISNLTPYYKALDYIVFFPNIYVKESNYTCSKINTAKLKRFKNFAAASIRIDQKLLLGNVLYPCNEKVLPQSTVNFLFTIKASGIVIKFDVGEMNITPNRENIIYNTDTIHKINDRILAVREELEELLKAKVVKDYDNLEDYWKIFNNGISYDPIQNTIGSYWEEGWRVEREKLRSLGATFKGADYKDDFPFINRIFTSELPFFRGILDGGKIYTNKIPRRLENCSKLRHDHILMIPAKTRLTAQIKAFLIINYDGYCLMSNCEEQDYVNIVCIRQRPDIKSTANEVMLAKGAYECLKKKAKTIDFDTDPAYLQFKEQQPKASKIPTIKDIILHVYNKYGGCVNRKFDNLSTAISYIRGLKVGVIIGGMSDDESFWVMMSQMRGYTFIKARKDVATALIEANLSCIVDMGYLLREDPLINKVYTVKKHFPTGIDVADIVCIKPLVNKDTYKEFMQLRNYSTVPDEYTTYCINSGKMDSSVEYFCLKLKDCIKKWKDASSIVEEDDNLHALLTAAVVLTTKSHRINGSEYKKLKNSKLLKVLCRR